MRACAGVRGGLPWERCAGGLGKRRRARWAAEAGAAGVHAALVTAVVFALVFAAGGLEGGLAVASIGAGFGGAAPPLPPGAREAAALRERFGVPGRFVARMPQRARGELLALLEGRGGARRVLFARVGGFPLAARVRAVACVAAYARNTGRVAVLFWDVRRSSQRFEDLFEARARGFVVVDVAPARDPFLHAHAREELTDWPEFSTREVLLPSARERRRRAAGRAGDPRELRAPDEGAAEYLDSLASMDVHVVLNADDAFESRYASRVTQKDVCEGLLPGRTQRVRDTVETALPFARLTSAYPRDDQIVNELHTSHAIPYMLLAGLRPLMRRLLLQKLEAKRQAGVESPRAIFVHAQFGLGNRLRALGSAMAFAQKTDRVLVLVWVPDHHLNCRFSDLFVETFDFLVSDTFANGGGWPFSGARAHDATMSEVNWYNYMRMNGVQVNTASDPVEDDRRRHIYVSTAYVIQSSVTPFIIRTQSEFWQVLKTLTPHIDVVRLVDRLATQPVHSMMGVHIRGKSIKSDISGVGTGEYGEESSKRSDYWRNITQVDTFIDEMRRQPSDQLFYVAADQKEVLDRLDREFPSRVYYTPRQCDSRDRDCLPYAMADILLLAKCSTIRGSYWSSFSELSVRMGSTRFLLAGVDFGRPRRSQ